jgi:hypothetical protein
MLSTIQYVYHLAIDLTIALPGLVWRTVRDLAEKWWYSHY